MTVRWFGVRCVIVLTLSTTLAEAQTVADGSTPLQLASLGPRFLSTPTLEAPPRDVSGAPALQRRVTVELERVTLKSALDAITEQTGLHFAGSRQIVPFDRLVSLSASHITVAAVLFELLTGMGLDVQLSPAGDVAVLVPRSLDIVAHRVQGAGTISGRVTDAKTAAPIPYATVVLEGTKYGATTSDSGRYTIAGVPPGTYAVIGRILGYVPTRRSVAVAGDQAVTADFALEKSPGELAQVVTTGTVVPTEVKALPTPVSIISDSAFSRQMPLDLAEIFRQQVPSAVAFDEAAYPGSTSTFSLRGSSTLSGSTQIKVYVDGQDVALASNVQIDPASIDHIEVIRGPEAAAVYGSDAIGGVMQIFTKRGDPNATHPDIDLQAALGVTQTPYDGFRDVPRQMYNVGVRGGGSQIGYTFGGNYSFVNNYIPDGEISKQSNIGAYGGMRYTKGMLSADLSARFNEWNMPNVVNPQLFTTGVAALSKPNYLPDKNDGDGFGGRLQLTPASWLTTTATLGVDAFTSDISQTRPRLSYPGDTLLLVLDQTWTRTNLGLNASASGRLAAGVTGTVTVGIDHYSYPITQFFSDDPTNSGTLNGASATRTLTTNTGAFVQGQLGLFDALFVTAGVRVEANTEFGDSLHTPVSPRVGLSYVRSIGAVTAKVRGSYGTAIRPPDPELKLYQDFEGNVTLANPRLGPERQFGGDAGVDLELGQRVSFSATYFNQTANNLILGVPLQSDTLPTSQYQNIGQVRNLGVELETSVRLGMVSVHAQYGYTRSRLVATGPGYSGTMEIGDQILGIPQHTAGASATATPFKGTTVTVGVTYVDNWTNGDDLAYYRCLGGTGPCYNTNGNEDRSYTIQYPNILKFDATVSQRIMSNTSGFVTVHNLTNSYVHEVTSSLPVMGRTTMIGVRWHY